MDLGKCTNQKTHQSESAGIFKSCGERFPGLFSCWSAKLFHQMPCINLLNTCGGAPNLKFWLLTVDQSIDIPYYERELSQNRKFLFSFGTLPYRYNSYISQGSQKLISIYVTLGLHRKCHRTKKKFCNSCVHRYFLYINIQQIEPIYSFSDYTVNCK